MIRTVNLSMAVTTASVNQSLVREDTDKGIPRDQRLTRMNHLGMAPLTEERPRGDQQLPMIRAVRPVAAQAVLTYRSVLPDKWTAFLRMALVTEMVHRIPFDERFGVRSVWRMTVNARHLSLEERHMGALPEFGTLPWVAAQAGLIDTLRP
jgi:hypothetical protein